MQLDLEKRDTGQMDGESGDPCGEPVAREYAECRELTDVRSDSRSQLVKEGGRDEVR